MRPASTNNPNQLSNSSRQPKLLILLLTAAACCLPAAVRAQTLQFANQSFVLLGKTSDAEKIENDYLPTGQTEADWSERLLLIRFPNAKDVKAFADNLCLAVNTQRPGAGAAVSQYGSDCYVAYAVTSSTTKGQLTMVHRILIDPQGGVRTYVFAQRPSISRGPSEQAPMDRDQCIRALGRLSPITQLIHD